MKPLRLFGIFAGSAALATGGLLGFAGCGGESAEAGLDEPIIVHGATFIEGDLPGSPPVDATELDAGTIPPGPTVTGINARSFILNPGQSDEGLSGTVTGDSSSVALRFADIGTGYWVQTLGPPDDTRPGDLGWSLTYDVGANAPAGKHTLRFAAIDGNGSSGPQNELPMCITRLVPDNLNSCQPTLAPPFAVLSLAWDTLFDLDLVVVTPDGTIVDPKHTSTAATGDGGTSDSQTTEGVLDHDANAGCIASGGARENLVWQAKPAIGTYLVYARVFSACGVSAARFTASLWFSTPTGDNDAGKPTYALVEKLSISGEALANQANGDSALGDYVTAFTIN